ncbi:MAG: GHMP kinase [Oligoflexia bacterium]|nr:GHMP kinase [Oligoflexia bacterium]
MIISRTPFRLSFAGGGSDLASFYQNQEGAVISTAINKYMHITVNKRFDNTIRLSYSKTEICQNVDEIEHKIFKHVLQKYAPEGGLEIISMADIPSGTGLGSSSSFTVALLHALKGYKGIMATQDVLAEEACDIEIEKLHEPIGKQDQYIAAFGGLQFIRFLPNGKVFVEPVVCLDSTKKELEASCMMFFTGLTRDAKTILSEQKTNTTAKTEVLKEMVSHAHELKKILEQGKDLKRFGEILNQSWELKKTMASNVSNPQIDQWYGQALEAGALGGKILGAGGGGFLMLFCEPKKQMRVKEALKSLKVFNTQLEPQGSRIIFVG